MHLGGAAHATRTRAPRSTAVRITGASDNDVVASVAATPDQAGLMFWFTRNRFFGSYFALIDASRA